MSERVYDADGGLVGMTQADVDGAWEVYADVLRERDEARAEVERLKDDARFRESELANMRALLYAQNEVMNAVRSLRQRGGENPSRGVWPALHEVFDALDVLDQQKAN